MFSKPSCNLLYHSLYLFLSPMLDLTDHVNYEFPEPDIESEEAGWIKIQTKSNNKCRDTEKA